MRAVLFSRLHTVVANVQLSSLHRRISSSTDYFTIFYPAFLQRPFRLSFFLPIRTRHWRVAYTFLFLTLASAVMMTLISETYSSLSSSFIPFDRASLSISLSACLNYLSPISFFPFRRPWSTSNLLGNNSQLTGVPNYITNPPIISLEIFNEKFSNPFNNTKRPLSVFLISYISILIFTLSITTTVKKKKKFKEKNKQTRNKEKKKQKQKRKGYATR